MAFLHRKIQGLPHRCRKLPAAVTAPAVMGCRSGSHRGAGVYRPAVSVPPGSRPCAARAGAAQDSGTCPALSSPVQAVVWHRQSGRQGAATARARLASHVDGLSTACQAAQERCPAGSLYGTNLICTASTRHYGITARPHDGIDAAYEEQRTVYEDNLDWVMCRILRARRQLCIL